MSDNAPQSFKVASTLTSNRVVTFSTTTADTVVYPASALDLPLGITTDDVKDTNQAIPVQTAGIRKLLFNDTCGTGMLVASDSSGRGGVYADSTAGAAYVGNLIGASVAATGTVAQVFINPGYKAIP